MSLWTNVEKNRHNIPIIRYYRCFIICFIIGIVKLVNQYAVCLINVKTGRRLLNFVLI